jgi:hypothetical protein
MGVGRGGGGAMTKKSPVGLVGAEGVEVEVEGVGEEVGDVGGVLSDELGEDGGERLSSD